MLLASCCVLRCVRIFFQQFLVCWIENGISIRIVDVSIDQIYVHTKVVLGQHFEFVISFQGSRIVVDEPLSFERIRQKLEIERDVWKCVLVFNAADYV